MFHSNITTGSIYKVQPKQTMFQALCAAFQKAFFYSPEDKFVQTKQAADQLEALYEMQASEEHDIADFETPTPKFTFWV